MIGKYSLTFVSLALSAVPAHAQSAPALPPAAPIIAEVVGGFIVPGYAAFRRETTSLAASLTTLCASPSQGGVEAARQAFGATTSAWGRVETIRFGPVTEQNRLERVLFWPDRKGTGLRQVQAALADEDPTASDPARLAGKSVAMQGLGALEFVLYGTGNEVLAEQAGSYRCAYGRAISQNLDTIAAALETEWARPDGFAAQWMSPGPANPLYRDDAEALGELLDTFITGLEIVRDVRLGGFLGETEADDKPRQAVFWRSAGTVGSLEANMAGLKALFDVSGLGSTLPSDSGWIPGSIDFEFNNAMNAAKAAAGAPVADLLADPQRRGKLAYFGVVTSSLSELFGMRLSAAFGLTAGFSSLDGD